jgi:hypothetical protein
MTKAKIVSYIILLIVSLFNVSVGAEKVVKLQLLAGLPKPPYIIEENGKGLQLEIIRKAN